MQFSNPSPLGQSHTLSQLAALLLLLLSGCGQGNAPQGSTTSSTHSAAQQQQAVQGMQKYDYLAADGGPHIVLPDSQRANWHGIPPHGNVMSGQYGLACAVAGKWGLVQAGQEKAFVFGGSPAMTAWATSPDGYLDLILLESWYTLDLDRLIDAAEQAVATSQMQDTGQTWAIAAEGLTKIWAGDSPSQPVYDPVRMPVKPGTYRILEGQHSSADGSLVLYRLVPIEDTP